MKFVVRKNLKEFKNMFDIINRMTKEVNINMGETGITILATDRNVSAFSIKFDKDFFDEYVCEQQDVFGTFVSDIYTPLKKAPEWFSVGAANGKLLIQNGRAMFKVPMLEEVSEIKTLPDVSFVPTVQTEMSNLYTTIEQTDIIDNGDMKFFVKDGKLTAVCYDSMREVVVEICDMGDTTETCMIGKEFLKNVVMNTQHTIEVGIKKDAPFIIKHTGAGYNYFIMIAPREEQT